MAPNVAASATMNSHIVNFLLEIRNGDGSMAAPCIPPAEMAESLTFPPSVASYPQREHDKQISPQHRHEVPVQRGRGEHVHRPGAIIEPKASQRIQQRTESAEHV